MRNRLILLTVLLLSGLFIASCAVRPPRHRPGHPPVHHRYDPPRNKKAPRPPKHHYRGDVAPSPSIPIPPHSIRFFIPYLASETSVVPPSPTVTPPLPEPPVSASRVPEISDIPAAPAHRRAPVTPTVTPPLP